jgi:hypothetical protein
MSINFYYKKSPVCYKCHQKVYFASKGSIQQTPSGKPVVSSKSGKPIPLDSNGEWHVCPTPPPNRDAPAPAHHPPQDSVITTDAATAVVWSKMLKKLDEIESLLTKLSSSGGSSDVATADGDSNEASIDYGGRT